jgi:hypothetical protein
MNSFVEQFISELEMIKPSTKQQQAVGDPAPRWIKPPRGFAKVNVDVAISKKIKQGLGSGCGQGRGW